MEKIREAFKAYFAGDDSEDNIELPQEIAKKGEISKSRWGITYLLKKDEEGKAALEFLETHPQTNMRHLMIKENGEMLALDCPLEGYSYDPEKEGDEERAEKEWRDYNKRVYDDLEAKGLL